MPGTAILEDPVDAVPVYGRLWRHHCSAAPIVMDWKRASERAKPHRCHFQKEERFAITSCLLRDNFGRLRPTCRAPRPLNDEALKDAPTI
ncbi:hypothetical protein MRX96_047769 [Rhipicephalus microplus]